MRIDEHLEKVEKVLEELNEHNLESPIIVEGEHDESALRELGINGKIIILNQGMSILHVCEDIAKLYECAIILTDWDRKGGVLAHMLKEKLAANAVRYNQDIRARLSMLCKKEIKDVESLPGYLERLRYKHNRVSKTSR